ncbi:MAG: EscD/YscD/HrpQ family type III secretion system inner membrane ring protein [Chlamydiae bacterium]|nr:MAG: EscD/YscD/HrpQ family type III secretion system inner membrane ring protein [Chlamydiota bacterium]
MAGYLIGEEGPLTGFVARFEEEEEWVLGRDPEVASIVLEDPLVSRRHVICRHTEGGYVLENVSTTNPALVNGQILIEPVLLQEGDLVKIGSSVFTFSHSYPNVESEDVKDDADLIHVRIGSGSLGRFIIKVTNGPNAGAEFSMQKGSSYVLGKDPNLCDIAFQDLSVSRQHARISIDDNNQVFIEDLSSRNGVLVNGIAITSKHLLSSEDLISLGTTSFLLIDREQIQETIFSPLPLATSIKAEELKQEESPASDWREMIIPKKHLIVASAFGILVLAGITSMITLFKTHKIEVVSQKEEHKILQENLKAFPDVQFSFNPPSGKLFLLGHVISSVEKQELLYKIENLSFVHSIEDNVIVDELIWENTNALLLVNPNWIGVSLSSTAPGKFVLRGYVQTLEQAQTLSDYLNLNFPYLDRLENQVIVETNLQMQVESVLIEKGFSSVTYQLSNGELVLAGRVDQKKAHTFNAIIDQFYTVPGIRLIKNFVIYTKADTSRIDISSKYQITGYSKKDDQNMFVVINGKILTIEDVVDGMKITEILSNTVLLEKDGVKFRINYNLQ